MRARSLLITGLFAAGVAIVPVTAGATDAPAKGAVLTQHSQADEFSAAKRKRARGASSYGQGHQIACNAYGCRPIPRGCQIVPERTWSGTPTGQDAVICPRRY